MDSYVCPIKMKIKMEKKQRNIEIITPVNLRKGMIIRFKEDLLNPNARNWIVLPVTKKDLKRGINADKEGLYAFGGMWYGRNPMKIESYGKILPIKEEVYLVRKDLHAIKVSDIQKLTN